VIKESKEEEYPKLVKEAREAAAAGVLSRAAIRAAEILEIRA
jgi:hypothetical protein